MAGAQGGVIFSCFNFRLRSQIELGELTPADDVSDRRPIVEIRRGSLPEMLAGAGEPQFGLQVAGDQVLLSVPQVGRYLIRGGDEIVVDALPDASERNVRLFLLGSALGILTYRRGLLPLHANAVVIDGRAVAFTGHSGAGKSTLAAHFAQAGREVLCDDVCVISFDDGVPMAWPGLPRLKLWDDAAHAFGHDTTQLDRAIEGYEKFHVPIGHPSAVRPVPLSRLYLLGRAEEGVAGAITRLRGGEAMSAVMENSYRVHYLPVLGGSALHFRQCAMLLQHVEVYAATRQWGFDVFGQEADRLVAHASAA